MTQTPKNPKLTDQQIALIKSEAPHQTSKTIPTHKLLNAGITNEILANYYKIKDTASTNTAWQENHKYENTNENIKENKRSQLEDLSEQEYEVIRKKARLTVKEKKKATRLEIEPVLVDRVLLEAATSSTIHLNSSGKEQEKEKGKDSKTNQNDQNITSPAKYHELIDTIAEKLEKEKLTKLFQEGMSEQQMDQYEYYKRSHFSRSTVKRIMSEALGPSVRTNINSNVLIAMAGISKIFVGQIIEKALEMKGEDNNDRPLLPGEIRAAVQELRKDPSCYTGSKTNGTKIL